MRCCGIEPSPCLRPLVVQCVEWTQISNNSWSQETSALQITRNLQTVTGSMSPASTMTLPLGRDAAASAQATCGKRQLCFKHGKTPRWRVTRLDPSYNSLFSRPTAVSLGELKQEPTSCALPTGLSRVRQSRCSQPCMVALITCKKRFCHLCGIRLCPGHCFTQHQQHMAS